MGSLAMSAGGGERVFVERDGRRTLAGFKLLLVRGARE
jgi:hypothetical protein